MKTTEKTLISSVFNLHFVLKFLGWFQSENNDNSDNNNYDNKSDNNYNNDNNNKDTNSYSFQLR